MAGHDHLQPLLSLLNSKFVGACELFEEQLDDAVSQFAQLSFVSAEVRKKVKSSSRTLISGVSKQRISNFCLTWRVSHRMTVHFTFLSVSHGRIVMLGCSHLAYVYCRRDFMQALVTEAAIQP